VSQPTDAVHTAQGLAHPAPRYPTRAQRWLWRALTCSTHRSNLADLLTGDRRDRRRDRRGDRPDDRRLVIGTIQQQKVPNNR
jgi:hypothetical protein